jgi:2-methylaconitate cis-trans-isomerase PrpF
MIKLRCVIMRGGTSKAVFLHENELPSNPKLRDRVILDVFGINWSSNETGKRTLCR